MLLINVPILAALFNSEYGHLSSWNVSYGQMVKQGQVIAKSGNAGYSSGPHLHFGVKKNRMSDDPTKYLPSF